MTDNKELEIQKQKEMEEKFKAYFEAFQKSLEELPLPDIALPGDMEEIMLPADDGVKLRTWLFFPKDLEGPYPTVAVRCCYENNMEILKLKAGAFNKKGFAFAVQYCRGTCGSEGEWVPNVNERADGLSFMNFLENDERVKNVGYWGDSYLALTGWCMADAVPSKVKTMYLGVYGCFRHVSAYKDGLFRQDILTSWAMENAGAKIDADYMESAAFRPQAEVDRKLWKVDLPWYRDWITHTDADDPYWQEGFWGELMQIPSKVKIPVYVREGWYDHHLGSALCTWEALSEEVRGRSVLEIGPWNHFYMPCIAHQSTANLRNDSIESPMMWFYKILCKEENTKGEVRLYRIGADKWDVVPEFVKKGGSSKRLYLNLESPDKDYNNIGCDGELQAENENVDSALDDIEQVNTSTAITGLTKSLTDQNIENGSISFVYNPDEPLISYGSESTLHMMEQNGSLLQKGPDYRKDVISFVSDELTEDIHVNGEICVHLSVSSDAADTAFLAKVMENFADGETVNVRGSITTLAYRNEAPHRIKYEEGAIEKITIKMWAIDWQFKKGSRIRLDISSSDFPQYSVHTNNEGIWALQESAKTAHQTIYTGPEHESFIELPLGKNTE